MFMKPVKIVTILIILISLLGGYVIFKQTQYNNAHEGINLTSETISYPYSRYCSSEGKIYFNKPGAGYFWVKDADLATFQPLKDVSYRGDMGKDSHYVFFKADKVAGMNPATTAYLGNNFCRDGRKVFYANIEIKKADANSFAHLRTYYAFDKNHLYYKQNIVSWADVNSLHQVEYGPDGYAQVDEYICDEKNVFFRGVKITGANPLRFKVLNPPDGQYQSQYAFDGSHYFNDQYIISAEKHSPENGGLKLLSLDGDFGWHAIFHSGTDFYCYDHQRHELVSLGRLDNTAPLTRIDRGIYTDGKHVYFTFGKWNKTGGRMPHYTGHTTGICAVDGVDARDFKASGSNVTMEGKAGTLYLCGNQNYFHPEYRNDGNYNQALMILGTDGKTKELPIKNALSKSIDDYEGPSIFSAEFYKRLFNPGWDDQEY